MAADARPPPPVSPRPTHSHTHTHSTTSIPHPLAHSQTLHNLDPPPTPTCAQALAREKGSARSCIHTVVAECSGTSDSENRMKRWFRGSCGAGGGVGRGGDGRAQRTKLPNACAAALGGMLYGCVRRRRTALTMSASLSSTRVASISACEAHPVWTWHVDCARGCGGGGGRGGGGSGVPRGWGWGRRAAPTASTSTHSCGTTRHHTPLSECAGEERARQRQRTCRPANAPV